MKKFTLILVALVFSITFITGCGDSTESKLGNQEGNSILEPETVNFEDYKGDWNLQVVEDEDMYLFTCLEDYFGVTGVNIAEVNNNMLKGSIYSITGAPSYRQAVVDFEGEIEDSKVIASYEDESWEYTGNIEITFDYEKIIANITRDEMEKTPMWGIPEGQFTFVRPIETEVVNQSEEEKNEIEQFLFPMSKYRISPFNKGDLTDEMIINCMGVNIGSDFFDISEFGDKIMEEDGKVIFDESVMNDLANRYFGVNINEHKSYDITTYENGVYAVPALGGVSEYPIVQMFIKDVENEGTYYAVVDYMFDYPEEGNQLEYEYLVELENNHYYIIKAIKEIEYPVDFERLNQ